MKLMYVIPNQGQYGIREEKKRKKVLFWNKMIHNTCVKMMHNTCIKMINNLC